MDDDAMGCLMVPFALAYLAVVGVFFYGVAVLVFRHAFGVELPNPFIWLPPDWQRWLGMQP